MVRARKVTHLLNVATVFVGKVCAVKAIVCVGVRRGVAYLSRPRPSDRVGILGRRVSESVYWSVILNGVGVFTMGRCGYFGTPSVRM